MNDKKISTSSSSHDKVLSVRYTLSPQAIIKTRQSIYEEVFFNIGHQTKQSCDKGNTRQALHFGFRAGVIYEIVVQGCRT